VCQDPDDVEHTAETEDSFRDELELVVSA